MNRRLNTIICTILLMTGCGGDGTLRQQSSTTTIRMKGSDTMVILAQAWAREYMRRKPGISVYVEGGGTATGIQALTEGRVDLAVASRTLTASEAQGLVNRQHSLGVNIMVAKDALSIYLNPSNPMKNLTLEQVKGIFTGEIVNWKDVGGRDEAIIALSREPNSGTYLFFSEHLLDGRSYGRSVRTMPGTQAIVDEVRRNPSAIGYGGVAYGSDVVHCSINGVEPTHENVRNGSYPIARYLYLYSINQPQGIVREFVDWILSKEGQMTVKEVGYIPLYTYP